MDRGMLLCDKGGRQMRLAALMVGSVIAVGLTTDAHAQGAKPPFEDHYAEVNGVRLRLHARFRPRNFPFPRLDISHERWQVPRPRGRVGGVVVREQSGGWQYGRLRWGVNPDLSESDR